ncbi:MAG: hypothetical protein GF307_10905 [candidate division Zixibacteria bacterium]|nr:hypothetical protein [candidate division Zixibacteria bacterium]
MFDLHNDENDLYYRSLELILEDDYEQSGKLLQEYRGKSPDNPKTDIFLLLMEFRNEVLKMIDR